MQLIFNYYRPQTKFAKVMFLHLSVSRGACMVSGGRHGFRGACVVAGGGVHVFAGGIHGCRGGGHVWLRDTGYGQ